MSHLNGLVGVVTGASSGIGEGIARMLGRHGVNVALAARREEKLERLANEIESFGSSAIVVPTDLHEDDDLLALIERSERELGSIDLLVNSAGVADALKPIHETDIRLWDAELAVNLRAPTVLCARVLPGMRSRRRGYIVNISSEAGALIYPGMGAYCVSKHGLRVLTELIQEENQELGIKAWAICPGEVATPMADWKHGSEENFLTVEEVVDVVEMLLLQGDNVKMGPEILIRTMRNPFEGSPRESGLVSPEGSPAQGYEQGGS
jgi:short-subunit dehydrogenase